MNSKSKQTIRHHQFGYIFQSYNLIPEYTVIENAELPLAYRNISKKERRKTVISLLKKLGLEDKLDKYPSELSGGEQQRVSIVRTLTLEPEILLADEPTGSVDNVTAAYIIDMLFELNGKGVTICLVTHDMELAAKIPKHIEIKGGKVIHVGEGQSVL